MGVCVEKIACPDCGGSDCLQTFFDEDKNKYYGICFGGCGQEFKADPYQSSDGEPPEVHIKTQAELQEEVRGIQKCSVFMGLGSGGVHRGIPGSKFKQWGVRLLLSEYDGKTPYGVAFPYSDEAKLAGWKVATLKDKNFFSIGDTRGCELFGWTRACKIGGKRLYITEGEYDAIALDYALCEAERGTKFERKGYAVVSLTNGSGSVVKNLNKMRKDIKKRFKEVVLVFDNDEPGMAAEKAAQSVWPEILRCDKPSGCKDANDAVKKKLVKELANMAKWEAHKPPIQGVVRVMDVLERALAPPEYGLSYPYPELTEMTFGQRFSEAVCLGAGVGLGKTVTAHQFAAWNMKEHKEPCFMILLEEQNHHSVKNIAAKIDSIPYGNPNAQYDPEQLRSTVMGLQDKLFMWESDEDQYLRFDMDEIMEAIRFNAQEFGCRFVYLDNFTRLVDHLSPSDANAFINKYSSEIEGLATQLDIHIMCYSHLNPAKWGVSHEQGGEVFASQFTGSRGIMRSFPMLMSFRRNKHADIDAGMSRNNSMLGVIKNRKYGNEGYMKTQYLPQNGQLIANEWSGDLINEDDKKR